MTKLEAILEVDHNHFLDLLSIQHRYDGKKDALIAALPEMLSQPGVDQTEVCHRVARECSAIDKTRDEEMASCQEKHNALIKGMQGLGGQ